MGDFGKVPSKRTRPGSLCNSPTSSYREQLVIVRRDGTRESIAFQGQPGVPSGILEYFTPWASLDATGRATVSAWITGGARETAHLVRAP